MARFKTYVNGTGLLPGDLNSIEDDYETGYAAWKPLHRRVNTLLAGTSTAIGTYLLAGADQQTPVPPSSSVDANQYVMWLYSPLNVAAGSRAVKSRVRAFMVTNGSALTATLTVGLYPATITNGSVTAVGTVVSGSTVAFAAQAANTVGVAASTEFTFPANGFYVFAVAVTIAALAANTGPSISAVLQRRQV